MAQKARHRTNPLAPQFLKNEQAYVEQKNHTPVRQFLGYDRLEPREMLAGLNDLLKLRGLWRNLFCVTMKQESRHRKGSRQIRRLEKIGRTPTQRLIDSGEIQNAQKRWLQTLLADYNPFEMGKRICTMENRFWSRRDELYRQEAEEDRHALAGASPLPSEAPARPTEPRKKRTKNRVAAVSLW